MLAYKFSSSIEKYNAICLIYLHIPLNFEKCTFNFFLYKLRKFPLNNCVSIHSNVLWFYLFESKLHKSSLVQVSKTRLVSISKINSKRPLFGYMLYASSFVSLSFHASYLARHEMIIIPFCISFPINLMLLLLLLIYKKEKNIYMAQLHTQPHHFLY